MMRCLPVLLALGFPLITLCAWAHRGPPFPVLQNQAVGPLRVSVWSNPDVGNGIFYILVDQASNAPVPADLKVQLAIQPVSGRLPERIYATEKQKLKERTEFRAVVPFDKVEKWRVRVLLQSIEVTGEADTNVESMPASLRRLDLLLFTLPFLGLGLLWLWAVAARRRRRQRHRRAASVGEN